MNSSPTPAKGEFALTPMVPSATAEAGRTALKGLCELSDAEQTDQGLDFFSVQGALAHERLYGN